MLIAIGTVGALVLLFDLVTLLLHARVTRWMRRAA
jgi:ABC-type nitrate/sulfonate/bicarbonate transport system permease component